MLKSEEPPNHARQRRSAQHQMISGWAVDEDLVSSSTRAFLMCEIIEMQSSPVQCASGVRNGQATHAEYERRRRRREFSFAQTLDR